MYFVYDFNNSNNNTCVNHKAFCNQKFKLTCMGVHSNYNELQPVRNDVYYAVCATNVRTVFCIVAAPRLVTPIPQMALRDDAAADAAAAAAARDTSVDGAA